MPSIALFHCKQVSWVVGGRCLFWLGEARLVCPRSVLSLEIAWPSLGKAGLDAGSPLPVNTADRCSAAPLTTGNALSAGPTEAGEL